MPAVDDAEYFENRRRSALAMSQAAPDPAIQKIHLELARRYADRAGTPDLAAESDLILPGHAGEVHEDRIQ